MSPMWAERAKMTILISRLIVAMIARSCLNMLWKGALTRPGPFMAARLSRLRIGTSVGSPSGGFSPATGQVLLSEREERGGYAQIWGKLEWWMFTSIVSSSSSSAVWAANVCVATVVAMALTREAAASFAYWAVG